MATLKIYPGCTGMQESLTQIDREIAARLAEPAPEPPPRSALEMFALEARHQERARRLADLQTARAVLVAHLDEDLLGESATAARDDLRKGGAKRIKSCGWRWTSILLRGGLRLKLETPYLRPCTDGRPGRKRTKRGAAGSGIYPLLWALGVDERFSPLVRSDISRQVVLSASYEEAREELARQGLELDSSSIVRVAVSTGKDSLARRQSALEAALKAPLPEKSSLQGQRVRVALDGGRARTRETRYGRGIRPGKNGRRPFSLSWLEPRVLTIDLLDEKGEPLASTRPIYEGTLSAADETFFLLTGTLRLLGVHLAAEVVFVADGAEWIWRRIEKAFTDAGVEAGRLSTVLDFFHATEHISDALAACKDLAPEARSALFDELRRDLLESGGAGRVIARLGTLARGRRSRAVKREIRYLEGHLERMCYAETRAKRLSIGSGVVESAIRRVVNLRFKSASMCWRADHLEPLLHLRAIRKAGHWDQFFQASLRRVYWLDAETSAFTSNLKPPPRKLHSSPIVA